MSGVEDLFGLVGRQLEGKYAVEAVVARGGFGVVYRAYHVVLQTQHAVKVLRTPPNFPEELRARFLMQFADEARIIAQLEHPAIVRVTDFGVSQMATGEQCPWMVLEWIDGRSLGDELLARRGVGGRSPRECFDLLRPVIDALAAAHEMGIAHRDIKPGNIMLASEVARTRRGQAARPTARVLDFGIAKIMGDGDDGPSSGQTKTASLMPSYSPRYASPEQLSGTRTGPWTDVHALGLVLTEMLTDQAPYEYADKLKLAAQVMSPVRPTPARFGVDVGPWEPVLARAMALTPSERFAHAGEFLEALEAEVPSRSSHLVAQTLPLAAPTMTPMHGGSMPTLPVANLGPRGSSAPPHPPVATPVAESSTLRPSTLPAPSPSRPSRVGIGVGVGVFVVLMLLTVVTVLTRRGANASQNAATARPFPPPANAPPPVLPTSSPPAQPVVVQTAGLAPASAPVAAPPARAVPAQARTTPRGARPARAPNGERGVIVQVPPELAPAPRAPPAPPTAPPQTPPAAQPARPNNILE